MDGVRKTQNKFLKRLDDVGPSLENPIFGFIDRAACSNEPNKIRVLNTRKIKHLVSRKKIKLFGFMALNGNDAALIVNNCKATTFVDLLEAIRHANGSNRPIVGILDNARIHHAKISVAYAESHNIYLVYLPPYSPHLNPIEFSWKDLKKELNKFVSFDEASEKAIGILLDCMKNGKTGYAGSWLEKFGDVIKSC